MFFLFFFDDVFSFHINSYNNNNRFANRDLIRVTSGCVMTTKSSAKLSLKLSKEAQAFRKILTIVYETILQRPKGYVRKHVRFSMMPTLRANDSVCVKSNSDGFVYFNLMAFSQQGFYDAKTNRVNDGRRPWIYYVMRCDRVSSSSSSSSSSSNGKGLYDRNVRERLKLFLRENLKGAVVDGDDVGDGGGGGGGEIYSRGWVELL